MDPVLTPLLGLALVGLAGGALDVRRRRRRRPEPDAGSRALARCLPDAGASHDAEVEAYLEASAAAGSELAARALRAARRHPAMGPLKVDEMKADVAASGDPAEKMDVVRRWHSAGHVFPGAVRAGLLKAAGGRAARDEMRRMFDEQDGLASGGGADKGVRRTEQETLGEVDDGRGDL